jgi:pSer/pThr/pTyr-binding forkhead associated (FHA) protein
MASLVITEGPAAGTHFALGQHRLVLIGRDEQCTFQVLDDEVSRRHLQIKLDPDSDRHVAIDFGSANGVAINGTRIRRDVPLVDGDAIGIGRSTIVYTTEDYETAQGAFDAVQKRGEWRRSTRIGD